MRGNHDSVFITDQLHWPSFWDFSFCVWEGPRNHYLYTSYIKITFILWTYSASMNWERWTRPMKVDQYLNRYFVVNNMNYYPSSPKCSSFTQAPCISLHVRISKYHTYVYRRLRNDINKEPVFFQIRKQWRIQDLPGSALTLKSGVRTYYFGQIFPKKWMKMREIWPRVGNVLIPPP